MKKKNKLAKDFLFFMKKYHSGIDRAVKTDELTCIFRVDGDTLHSMIHNLRMEGHPVCGDHNGYFYASCDDEIEHTARWLMQMGWRIQRTACAMLSAADLDRNASDTLKEMWKVITDLKTAG
jgi:hypothetical protein